jgi:hypothetical protein
MKPKHLLLLGAGAIVAIIVIMVLAAILSMAFQLGGSIP